MGNTACEPAAKLQKSVDGDVSAAPSPEAAMQGVTPDQPEANTASIEDTAGDANTASTALKPASVPQMAGGKKRKVALYISYIGAGYHGMQRNPGYPSIEGELEKAICNAGGISEANAESFTKINWMRAARTDKGVSAIGQVVSLKMVVGFTTYDVISNINKHLPDQIRVLGYTKTTAGFDARKHCDKRRYEYVLPVWAFDPTSCRGRIDAEEAELASAADPSLADGGLPSGHAGDQPETTTDKADHQAAKGTVAAAVPAEGDCTASSAVGQPPRHAQGSASADVDLPQPDPNQALHQTTAAASPTPPHAPDPPSPPPIPENGLAQRVLDQPGQPANSPALANLPRKDRASAQGAPGGPAQAYDTNQPPQSEFVFDDAAVRRLSSILHQYEGTHNFHNFTVRLEANDPSAKRYMLSCRCTGVFDIQGQQWVRIVIIGQSFMLHQIRKMVGMAVAIMRGDAPEGCIRTALQPKRTVPTPMAPEVGLFLDECYYDAYNTRWGSDHEPVTLSQFQQNVDKFKAELMYPHIATTDSKGSINATWLRSLNNRNYHFTEWQDEKKFRAVIGPRGEKAIINGDILPSPAGAACIVCCQESYGLGRTYGRTYSKNPGRTSGRTCTRASCAPC
ncbi:hypothetical protein ABBQ38_010743 [Trebouxia sp. C0009 RCD-2024]